MDEPVRGRDRKGRKAGGEHGQIDPETGNQLPFAGPLPNPDDADRE